MIHLRYLCRCATHDTLSCMSSLRLSFSTCLMTSPTVCIMPSKCDLGSRRSPTTTSSFTTTLSIAVWIVTRDRSTRTARRYSISVFAATMQLTSQITMIYHGGGRRDVVKAYSDQTVYSGHRDIGILRLVAGPTEWAEVRGAGACGAKCGRSGFRRRAAQ